MITIRIATADDAALIADISRETFYDTFAVSNTREDMEIFMTKQFSRKVLMEEAATTGSQGNVFFIAYHYNEPAGYAFMRNGAEQAAFESKPAVEIARIYAVAGYIGKGIGKALMQQCVDKAKDLHKKILWLGVWEKNINAIKFYSHFGFEKFGQHNFLLGNDLQTDWLMKKEL